MNKTDLPKSAGNDDNDISFKPNTVRFFNCEKPAGKRGIGFELKSATCKLCKCLMSSGMSAISVSRKKIKALLKEMQNNFSEK